ncbi:MAG: lamin tail domain-containing protein, partial [Clostridia bacterium]|nr:lamin tail domain-containing protein [Clostridia bacterium]
MISKTRLERWAPATFAIAVFFIVALLVGSRFFASSTHAQMQLQITEIMPDNRTAFADDDGLFYDWAEITNLGAEAVDLSNFSLTDDTSKPNRYSFPRKTLNPNESVVVFLTGKNKENREFYAPFSLDNDGE